MLLRTLIFTCICILVLKSNCTTGNTCPPEDDVRSSEKCSYDIHYGSKTTTDARSCCEGEFGVLTPAASQFVDFAVVLSQTFDKPHATSFKMVNSMVYIGDQIVDVRDKWRGDVPPVGNVSCIAAEFISISDFEIFPVDCEEELLYICLRVNYPNCTCKANQQCVPHITTDCNIKCVDVEFTTPGPNETTTSEPVETETTDGVTTSLPDAATITDMTTLDPTTSTPATIRHTGKPTTATEVTTESEKTTSTPDFTSSIPTTLLAIRSTADVTTEGPAQTTITTTAGVPDPVSFIIIIICVVFGVLVIAALTVGITNHCSAGKIPRRPHTNLVSNEQHLAGAPIGRPESFQMNI